MDLNNVALERTLTTTSLPRRDLQRPAFSLFMLNY